METKKENRGGARENAGRLKKDELISLIQSMDAVLVPKNVWEKLAEKVNESDVNAIKTWLNYRYGLPKATIDADVNATISISFED